MYDVLEVNLIFVLLDAVFDLVRREKFDELLFDNVRRHGGEEARLRIARFHVELDWFLGRL